MDLEDKLMFVNSPLTLAEFVFELAQDYSFNASTWENDTLERFLEAMARWLEDASNKLAHENRLVPENPSWRDFALLLIAARGYE